MMQWSPEQQSAIDKYNRGENIFLTGPGGSGKSTLIKYMYTSSKRSVSVCAMTGCAALLLDPCAKTLHSWAGIYNGDGSIDDNISRASKYARKNWVNTDVLIIDEVSMLSLKLFVVLDAIGQALRRSYKPFGGIQLVFSGDFYQLPPIGNDDPATSRFCFQAFSWPTTFSKDNHVQLKKLYRQQSDDCYAAILNQIRVGRLNSASNTILIKHVNRAYDEELVIKPTKLLPTRNGVYMINNDYLEKLTTPLYKFNAEMVNASQQRGTPAVSNEIKTLSNQILCGPTVYLKEGCQVMCVINIVVGGKLIICNGSQGIVTGFKNNIPVVKYNNGVEMSMPRHTWPSEKIKGLGISQIPLLLAWALTIHKSQGATLDCAEVDVGSDIFECGQTYVALSRVKSLNGLYLSSFDASKIRINGTVQEFYKNLNTT